MRHHMRITSNKPRNIKYHNQKLILSMFRKKESLSIAEIANRINLSKTTVTKVVNEFEAKGLVLATGKGNSTDVGGKKPEIFAFNAAYSYVIALTINPNTMTGAVMDLKCNFISQRTANCTTNTPYQVAVQDMADMIRGMVNDLGLNINRLHPIVIGCEGIIDADNGIIHYSIHHSWGHNLPLREDLAQALGTPANIYVDNNLRLAGYVDMLISETVYNSQAVLTTTYSAGGSILENQQLVHGANGFVGEFGHMIIEPHSDIRCDCGGYGCFGALVSPNTVLAQAHKQYAQFPQSVLYPKIREGALKITDIFEASNQDDPFACFLIDQVIHYFAIVIQNIVLLRDPEKIIVQGFYTAAGDYFLLNLRKKVNSFPFYKMERNLPIEYSAVSGSNAYLTGAAYYAVDILLDINSIYD
jgi:predicted NBD/HSP70 family sugar kinase/DNA-binding XRE family transcriptional regulator